jgi:hypothetical protein
MASSTDGNDPFFGRIVRQFYEDANRRHPRFPLVRNLEFGIALFELPSKPEDYLQRIEASARRNVKKATRLGYSFARIDFNARRSEVAEILSSATIRQGLMPAHLTSGQVPAISDPTSLNPLHDYVYVGILRDGVLRAYAACMVAGQLFAITDIYGHHAYQPDGVVPLLFVELVKYARTAHPQTRYCMYDKYFGASDTLRRFKKKFGFMPHKVSWELD